MKYEINLLKLMIKIAILAMLVVMGIHSFLSGLILVHQSSMNPTLEDGDMLIVNKFIYIISKPQVNDIVILFRDDPTGIATTRLGSTLKDYFKNMFNMEPTVRYVKRIVATEGDIVDIKNGNLYINGELMEEDFTIGKTYSNQGNFPQVIEPGYVFVLGDNREISLDSRRFGQVPIKNIESRVEYKLPSE
ncbi:MAG: signal peptidase I [Epulopiscium sp. Nuni2H_MBin003]|nr:MAG: signal peptidase I [Epulopiscium sp. Nuni2H_MBin003]